MNTAKKDGSWTILDDIEDLIIPEDLKNKLKQNKTAYENFEAFTDSTKKQVLYWITTAKMKDTRLRRIKKTVELAAKNKTPL
ncbi:MAG: YdeI/OmpD-associated family protein [Methanobacterium sp.]